LTSLLPVQTPP